MGSKGLSIIVLVWAGIVFIFPEYVGFDEVYAYIIIIMLVCTSEIVRAIENIQKKL